MATVECYQNQNEKENQNENENQSQNENENESEVAEQQETQGQEQQQQQQQQATAGIPGKDDERKLFVGGLSRNTTDKELREHFGKFGEIESISIKVDPYTGISRGFAFMVFTNPKTIDKVLASGEHYINKRKVDPKRVSKKPQHGKIFVGGLTPEITEEDIKNYFSQYGTIVDLQAPFDKVKNQRKKFCFVTFDSKDVVFKLLKTPKQTINGKEVDVKKVKVYSEWTPRYWGNRYPCNNLVYGYSPDYRNRYYEYDDVYAYYVHSGYDGYDNMGYGAQGKPRGNGQGPRQFQRHQPY